MRERRPPWPRRLLPRGFFSPERPELRSNPPRNFRSTGTAAPSSLPAAGGKRSRGRSLVRPHPQPSPARQRTSLLWVFPEIKRSFPVSKRPRHPSGTRTLSDKDRHSWVANKSNSLGERTGLSIFPRGFLGVGLPMRGIFEPRGYEGWFQPLSCVDFRNPLRAQLKDFSITDSLQQLGSSSLKTCFPPSLPR